MAGRRGLDWTWDGTWPPPGSALENERARQMSEFASDVALRLCGRSLRDVAADVSSEAVWSVVQRLRVNAGAVDNLEGYLVKAVYNRFRDDARTRARGTALVAELRAQPAVDRRHSPEAAVVAHADVATVFDRLRRRRPRLKDGALVLQAHRLLDAGYSQQETADRLGITRNNLAQKLADYTHAARDLRRLEEAEE
jgi:DNA-directed RNA polymerase specialized sigma24 family protein